MFGNSSSFITERLHDNLARVHHWLTDKTNRFKLDMVNCEVSRYSTTIIGTTTRQRHMEAWNMTMSSYTNNGDTPISGAHYHKTLQNSSSCPSKQGFATRMWKDVNLTSLWCHFDVISMPSGEFLMLGWTSPRTEANDRRIGQAPDLRARTSCCNGLRVR